jgi:glutaredoxin 3
MSKQFIESALILGKEGCPHCVSAQAMLKKRGVNFTYQSLGKEYTEEEFLDLAKLHNHRTFPMVFINDAFIGGASELNKFLRGK